MLSKRYDSELDLDSNKKIKNVVLSRIKTSWIRHIDSVMYCKLFTFHTGTLF